MHSKEGIKWLARMLGWRGRGDPKMITFGKKKGFSRYTAFILSSDKTGYYQTTLEECSCPDYEYRRRGTGERCKHQEMLAKFLGVRT